MKTIKTRNSVKSIKTLDRAGNLADRTKNNVVKTKERAEETHDSQYSSPNDYANSKAQEKAGEMAHKTKSLISGAAQIGKQDSNVKTLDNSIKTAQKTKENAETLKNTANEAKKTAAKANAAVKDAKQNYQKIRQTERKTILDAKQKFKMEKSNLFSKKSVVRTVDKNSAKNIKHATKSLKSTAKGSIKTAKKSIKSAKKGIKTAKTTAKTVKFTVKKARRTILMAKFAATKGILLTKLTIIGLFKMVKLAILAVKKLVALIIVGAKVIFWVVIILLFIIAILGTVFAIFYASAEDPNSGWNVNKAITLIDIEFNAEIDDIIASNYHDFLNISGVRAAWREVLAVYAVKTVTDPDNPMEVATMNEEKYELLRAIFWDMNTIEYYIETHEIEVYVFDDDGAPTGETEIVTIYTLYIVVDYLSIDEITVMYRFTDEQMTWLNELLQPEYISLWNSLLFGISSDFGCISMVEIAMIQIGNIGGEKYWRWYGFNERVEWCAIFVSWVAEQNGLIQAGIIPRFASTSVGVQWFQSRGLWQPRGYTPFPGALIFFDWTGDGNVQHVGIVEYVENGRVHTIEGNSNDQVRRRSYLLNSVNILGYGIPMY